jgi:energy-coupling factor transporter ATP-binding protein EcfA2
MQADRAPVPDTAPLFETINVSKSFGAFKALRNISFGVNDGEFVSIVGPNGAGKTTLVNVVTGLLRPTAGEVRFLGRDIAGIGPVELARLGMSRAFQLVNIFPALTVRETLGVAVASRLRRVSNPFRSLKRDAVLQADTERVAEVLGLRAKLDTVASISPVPSRSIPPSSCWTSRPAGFRAVTSMPSWKFSSPPPRRRACAPSFRSSTTWTSLSGIHIASSRCRQALFSPTCRPTPSSPTRP